MSTSLFSPLWYRVSDRRPRLRAGVQITRQVARGTPWHVLTDPMSGRRCRLNPQAWELAGRLDGERSVDQIWEGLVDRLGADAPTQDEIVQLLGQLAAEGLITLDVLPDFASRAWRRGQRAARRRRERFNPFALRVPLGNPGPWLDRLAPLGRALFGPAGALAWLVLIGMALSVLVAMGEAWLAQTGERMGTPWMLFLAWLSYVPVKLVHEVAHGLAARRLGVEAPEAGVTLLVLVPSPYIDVSDSAALARRSERLLVAGAGIASDLALAAIGLLVWSEASPGLVSDLALTVTVVAGVGTVLFNANPLLRFDGYHLLCDALDLPQLATRSQRLWQQRWRRWVGLDASLAGPMATGPGERRWLEAYAPLAFACRIVLGLSIALWAGEFSSVLGLLIGGYVLVGLVAWPIVKLARDLLAATRGTAAHATARRRGALALAVATALFVALPLPFHTTVQGVVTLEEPGVLRPQVEGLVVAVHARDGAQIERGAPILTLDDPVLRARHARAEAKVRDLEAERYGQLGRDALRSTDGEEALRRAVAEQAELALRLERLELRAGTSGRLSLPGQDDLPGTWLERGKPVGHVFDGSALHVRAAVPEAQAALLRERLRGAQVRLADLRATAFPASVVRDTPAAVPELPGDALGRRGDGGLETDPADRLGRRARDPYVHVDVRVDALPARRVDGRAWVRFDHGWATPLQRAWRGVRQVFLRRFHAAS